jgi:hypothetical protein
MALEHLLDGPCYHMLEVFAHPEHASVWHAAIRGDDVDWDSLFEGYKASVDWPAAAFWREMSEHWPDALVVLSTRDSDGWWRSANNTIFEVFRGINQKPGRAPDAWTAMVTDMFRVRFCEDFLDRDAAIAAYEAHNAAVRATVPGERLVEWQPGDDWQPLCDALGVDVPEIEFPHVNTTEEFRSNMQLP